MFIRSRLPVQDQWDDGRHQRFRLLHTGRLLHRGVALSLPERQPHPHRTPDESRRYFERASQLHGLGYVRRLPKQHLAVSRAASVQRDIGPKWRKIRAIPMGWAKLDFMLGRWSARVAAGLLAASISPAAAQAEVIRGDRSLGPFRTEMKLSDAVRVFGTPDSVKTLPGFRRTCQARWIGILKLDLVFAGASCTNQSLLIRATAAGSNWRTLRGLKIGAAEAVIRSLYPRARRTRHGGGYVLLSRGRVTTLVAFVRNGKVRAFQVTPAVTGVLSGD